MKSSWGGVLSSPDSQATSKDCEWSDTSMAPVCCVQEQGGSFNWHTVAKGGVLFEEGRYDG